jgi:hypothetical protein
MNSGSYCHVRTLVEVLVETYTDSRLVDPDNVLKCGEFLVETFADPVHVWHISEEFILRFGV